MFSQILIHRKADMLDNPVDFTLTIKSNGVVLLSGTAGVKAPGKHCWSITSSVVKEINLFIDKVDFFNVSNVGTMVHQLNNSVNSVSIEADDGAYRRIVRNGDIDPAWPSELNYLETKIEKLCLACVYFEKYVRESVFTYS